MKLRSVVAWPLFCGVAALYLLAGCSVDPGSHAERGCEGCPEGECYLGFCLVERGSNPDAGPGDGGPDTGTGDGGSDAGLDAGRDASAGDGGGLDAGPEPCPTVEESQLCYDGPAATSTEGQCKAGRRTCFSDGWGPCLGQVLPQPNELCNLLDDDCDQAVDEDPLLAGCDTGEQGVCAQGQAVCQAGTQVCERVSDPVAETCNGLDDDCDGVVDEATARLCYPEGLSGCDPDGAGAFACEGTCEPGLRQCVDGVLGDCESHTPPASEACTAGGAAADEDCDGASDEGCECSGSVPQDCYGGPDGTNGVGECKSGTQSCEGGVWGACQGAVLPAEETCENEGADDDCDGDLDDVPVRGDNCTVPDEQGECHSGLLTCEQGMLRCIGPEPVEETCNGRDDDCNGRVDEDFDLAKDPENCGGCGIVCADTEECCAGTCVLVLGDDKNCGKCGAPCGSGLTCCGGRCVDTQSDPNHCNSCGNRCGLLGGCCAGKCGGICI